MRRFAAAIAMIVAAGCSTGSTSPTTATIRTPPDLTSFLRLPVATPTACPSTVSGSTSGRRSPWVGHVDVSVFLSPTADATAVRQLGATLRATPSVQTVYFEPASEALAEFRRLYTCSAAVSAAQIPASYRLVLASITLAKRTALLSRIVELPAVATLSCDPSSPCTNIHR